MPLASRCRALEHSHPKPKLLHTAGGQHDPDSPSTACTAGGVACSQLAWETSSALFQPTTRGAGQQGKPASGRSSTLFCSGSCCGEVGECYCSRCRSEVGAGIRRRRGPPGLPPPRAPHPHTAPPQVASSEESKGEQGGAREEASGPLARKGRRWWLSSHRGLVRRVKGRAGRRSGGG
jgi:hypothetical protein